MSHFLARLPRSFSGCVTRGFSSGRVFQGTGKRRTGAYLYGALGTFGLLCTIAGDMFELLGLGLILAALYLQGRMTREKIWTGTESTLERALGSVKRPASNKK